MSKIINPVDEIKKRLDIVDAVGNHIKLEKNGDRYVGFCPFHSNTNTPAFTIYPDQQSWWCYGCNKGGDIFAFLMEAENKEFNELIREYAEKFDIVLRQLSPSERQRFAYHKRLYKVLEAATDIFHTHLMWSPDAVGARVYLEHRGLRSETLTEFRVGYAPDSWDWLYKQLIAKGFSEKDIITAGLAKARRNSKGAYDYFRNRIVFPIQTNGKIMGFGGRVMGGSDGAKYVNTPNTPVFSKRRTVYGLVQARPTIRERGAVVIVEGYMDVLGLHQAGYKNAISIMGITLSKEQAELLSHHAKRAIVALDPDEAAEIAIERLRLERFTDLDLYIASLPGNKDPDELVLEDSDIWLNVVEAAKPIPIYMTDYLIKKHNPEDPKERRDVAQMVMPLIDIVKDPFEQVAYQEYLAEALGYKSYSPNPKCPHCGEKHYEPKTS
jgi:DNA primase